MILAPLALDRDDTLLAHELLSSVDSSIQLPDIVVMVSGTMEELILRCFEDQIQGLAAVAAKQDLIGC